MRLTDVPWLRNMSNAELVAFAMGMNPCVRLTLTQGTPITTTDVTGATSVFAEPYNGNVVPLFRDATGVTPVICRLRPSVVSVALGTLVSAVIPNDVFMYYAGAGDVGLEKLAWSSATARATAIDLVNGRYYKNGDYSRLYVGSFYPTATTTTQDSAGGVTTQVGGKRFLFNMFNRVLRDARVIDTTDSWAYATNTVRQANAAAGNKVETMIGVIADAVDVRVMGVVFLSTNGSNAAKVGVGVNSTTAFSGFVQGGYTNTSTIYAPVTGAYVQAPSLGYSYYAWCEKGADGSTSTFLGDNGADGQQAGLLAKLMM